MIIQRLSWLIVAFSLITVGLGGCARKNVTIAHYAIIEQPKDSLQDDFRKKAGDRVYFAFDKASLSADAKNTLKKQTEWLSDHPLASVVVEGYCDDIGTKEYNLALGLRRAEAVGKFLISQGIDKTRISMISFGMTRPEALDHTKEAHQLNRRVVTIVGIN